MQVSEKEREGERERDSEECVPLAPLCPDVILPHGSSPTLFNPPQAPSSLLEALEQHLASLEGRKLKDLSSASRYRP